MSLRTALRRVSRGVGRLDWKDMQENVRKRTENSKNYELPKNDDVPLWKRILIPTFIDDKALLLLFGLGGGLGLLLHFVLLPGAQDLKKEKEGYEEWYQKRLDDEAKQRDQR